MRRLCLSKAFFVSVAALLAVGLSAPVEGSIATYSFSGYASFDHDVGGGIVNPIDDVGYIVSLTGDTTAIAPFSLQDINGATHSGYALNIQTGTITLVADLANPSLPLLSQAITDPVQLWVNNTATQVGVTNLLDNSLLSLFNSSVLGAYTLTAPFGPIAAESYAFYNFDALLADGSILFFVEPSPDTAAYFSAVPIPAPVLLLATGIAGLIGIRRRAARTTG